MARKVAEANGVTCCDTFTGFKFMAEKKNELESQGKGQVIMSYEESYGYMLGDYVRDKDAVTASLILTEMAAWYAAQGMTLFDALNALYEKYGYYGEKTHNLVMPGLDGLEKMAQLMRDLRASCTRGWRSCAARTIPMAASSTAAPAKNPPWSCPAATCCAMSWRTAPPSWYGPAAPSPRSRSMS